MEENTEVVPSLSNVFEQSLAEPQSFDPQDLPKEWTVGQHRYIRVEVEPPTFDENRNLTFAGVLDKKLTEFRELGIKVLDYSQRWGFWIFKTMAPLD